MPTIYKYIGIIIRFFSDEHEPFTYTLNMEVQL